MHSGASGIAGFQLKKQTDSLITTLFADDTTVYLSKEDSFETLTEILNKWCRASGAKFNVEKKQKYYL